MNNIFNSIGTFVKKNAPQILGALGIVGFGATIAVTAKASIDIHEDLKREESEKGAPLTVKEKVKVSYKKAIPVVALAAGTTACFTGSIAELSRRNTLLRISKDAGSIAASAAVTTANTALADVIDKVKKSTDEETAKKILSNVVESDKNGATIVAGTNADEAKNVIISGSNDMILCYDAVTGSKFEATYNDIKDAVREIEKYVNQGETMTINDFRGYISEKLHPIDIGYRLGWKSSEIGYNWVFPITFEGKMLDGRWYMSICYDVVPTGEWY